MKRILIFIIIFFSIFTTVNSQIPQIKISSIQVSGKNVFISKNDQLKISDKDKLLLKFSIDGSRSEYDFRVMLNNQVIKADDNLIELTNLMYGNYYLRIEGVSKTGEDALPATLDFSVLKPKENKREDAFFNSFNIVLIAIILILSIIIIILLNKKKPQKPKSSKDEIEELRGAYDTLKEGYRKLEAQNRKLGFKIDDLKKNIKVLENANVSLLQQKEKLADQKIKLQELQKQKDKVFAIAVHDIKNPASAIKGLLELLTSYDLNAVEQREIMESLISSSENILKLTQNISHTIALEETEDILKKENASLKEIIDNVVAINSAAATKKRIKLVNKSSSSLPNVEIDKQKIEEAIDNLLNNAIKYSPAETEVIVKSYFSATEVSIEISDDGVGLSPEDQKNAFKKGVTLTPKPTGGESSSGLGLWIVKSIIEDHNGSVWVKSKLGVGSNFGFKIPIK